MAEGAEASEFQVEYGVTKVFDRTFGVFRFRGTVRVGPDRIRFEGRPLANPGAVGLGGVLGGAVGGAIALAISAAANRNKTASIEIAPAGVRAYYDPERHVASMALADGTWLAVTSKRDILLGRPDAATFDAFIEALRPIFGQNLQPVALGRMAEGRRTVLIVLLALVAVLAVILVVVFVLAHVRS